MDWKPIDTAPKDGSLVIVAKKAEWASFDYFPFPLTSKYMGGRWCIEFEDGWAPHDPQPTHWQPLPEPPND